MVVHANGMAFVKKIFQWADSGIESQGWEWRFLGTSNVDRRFSSALAMRLRTRMTNFSDKSASYTLNALIT